MRSCTNTERWLVAALMSTAIAAWVALVSIADVEAAGFAVHDARTRFVDGVYLLDAELEIEFAEESVEALNSGVPLTVVVELNIVQVRRFRWDKSVAKLEAKHQLRVHALSGQYILDNLNSGASRPYRTLGAAVDALGRFESFPMIDGYLLNPGGNYEVRLRARLDIESLPSPLRPVAYVSSLWRQDSEWSRWPLVR